MSSEPLHEGQLMRKVADLEHAAECRKMANQTGNARYKKQLQDMAEAWEMLATERQKQLDKEGSTQKNSN
jgi:hypothetical protein